MTQLPTISREMNIPIEDYLSGNEFSSGSFKLARKSLAHLKADIDGLIPHNATAATDFGNIFEAMAHGDQCDAVVFDPDNRPEPDKTMGSNANRQWKEELMANHRYVLPIDGTESWTTLDRMLTSLKASQYQQIVDSYEWQPTYRFDIDGLPIRSRPDLEDMDKHIIVDIKTARTASPYGFARQAAELDYPIQAALQCIAHHRYTGEWPRYFWLVVEKQLPHATTMYELDVTDRDMVVDQVLMLAAVIREAVNTDRWPGYNGDRGDIPALELPAWYNLTRI